MWRHLSECFALDPLTITDPVPKNRTRSLLAFSSAHLPLVKNIFSGPRNLENHRVIDAAHLAALLQKRRRIIIILQGHFCTFWIGQHQLKFGYEPMTQMRREISNLLANPCLHWFEYSCLITMFFVSVGVISQIAGLSVSSTSFLQ